MRRSGILSSQKAVATILFAVLIVGVAAAGVWMMTRGSPIAAPEPPSQRAGRQIREQLGPGAELRYAEAGQKRSVCGYVGRTRGGEAVAFISVPNRILFSDDPLPTEFREMRERYCPGFLTAPAPR